MHLTINGRCYLIILFLLTESALVSRFLDSKSSPFISYPTASISFHLSFLTNVSWKVGQISALATVAFKWRRGTGSFLAAPSAHRGFQTR